MQQPIAANDPSLFSVLAESQYFDRKSARKDDKEIAKHISAFANAGGGKLVMMAKYRASGETARETLRILSALR